MKTFRLWIYGFLSCLLPETRLFPLKAALLRWCGAQVGTNVRINSSARFLGNGFISIGDDVWIGAHCLIMSTASATVMIGSQCDLAPQVTIITGTHSINLQGGHIAGKGTSISVSIGDGCWIGAKSLILPGVKLKNRTLVAAGSVVVRSNARANGLLAGNPAVLKKIYA